jgi:hypothetical protein
MASDEKVVAQTKAWIDTVVVKCNFCPFAGYELARNKIFYSVSRETGLKASLMAFMNECLRLDKEDAIETTLLIYPDAFKKFEDYLGLFELAEDLLVEQGYEGIYQLASFHPDYCFADAEQDDPANYTNRSIYPMLHLLREASVEQALENYSEPETIPQRNIEFARRQGPEKMRKLLDSCLSPKK